MKFRPSVFRLRYRIPPAWLALLGGGALMGAPPAEVEFNRDVRPILSNVCFKCLGPDAAANKSGLRLDLRDKAIACVNGMILILDAGDRVVSVVGGEPARYVDGELQPLVPFNYVFNHPHDVCADARGDLYVAQWNSNHTYPVKLERSFAT